MKTLLLSVLFLTSYNLMAKTCDLTATDALRAEANDTFDSGYMRGEDHIILLMEIDKKEGRQALFCVKYGAYEGLTTRALELALEASELEREEDILYLEQMSAHYEARGNYLMIEQIKDEKARVIQIYKELDTKIKALLKELL